MPDNHTTSNPIVVAGAGIGGLTASLALQKSGHQVILIERAEELSEVGAGLQLSPNALKVLDGLGLSQDLRNVGCAPDSVRIRSARNGADLARVPLGKAIEHRHGAPFLVIHRADLQSVLYRKAVETGGIDIRLGTTVTSAAAQADHILRCGYTNTAGGTGSLDAGLLVAADGVWSKLRQTIPDHNKPKFSGQVAYRSTIPASEIPDEFLKETGLWLGKNAHVVHYPVRSGKEFNIVALVAEDWQDETWSAPADRQEFLHMFDQWPVDLRNLLAKSHAWLKWALCGVPGDGPWIRGRIALLGDAAHAMLPYMAQGAAMAIEDAAVLARLLPLDGSDPAAALRTYERVRRPRVCEVQSLALRNRQVFHLSGLPAAARDTVLKLMPEDRLAARFDWLYGWTPDV